MPVKKKTASQRAIELRNEGQKPPQILEVLKKEGFKSRLGKPLKLNNVYGYSNKIEKAVRVKGLKRVKNPQASAQLDAISAITGVQSMADEQRLAIIKKIVS